jgi:hypothetical protein
VVCYNLSGRKSVEAGFEPLFEFSSGRKTRRYRISVMNLETVAAVFKCQLDAAAAEAPINYASIKL